ncbi:cholinephosphate cytidylyl transferase B2 [Culex quinquefasciatus]|uniref:Cholinephosphate cytidylyl transferase B2 n=1 Tax=Culex quinquefasciatus TaxID=7176 RepID=B0XGB5_CULQU|nr:cholinephosphate cytidylyl transferase B2 [Culex quinquefasciatus]|eukprot:XP_001868687.1 cholinephosphate cytidylyl transferase B2 [Culex quinquefasciatus]
MIADSEEKKNGLKSLQRFRKSWMRTSNSSFRTLCRFSSFRHRQQTEVASCFSTTVSQHFEQGESVTIAAKLASPAVVMQQEEPSPTGRMSRKRPREPAPVPASPDESSSVSITIPERPKNGAGGAKNGTDSGVSGSNSGSSNNNGATQKRFSSIRIEDDGMETGSSDNFWPPSDESIRNGHVSFGDDPLGVLSQNPKYEPDWLRQDLALRL